MKRPTLQRLRDRSTSVNRRFQLDLLALAVMCLMLGCLWNGVGRFVMVGIIVTFLPTVWTHMSKALDVALILDKAGIERGAPGRHSGRDDQRVRRQG